MFETAERDTLAQRLRTTSLIPIAAIVVSQLYLLFYPLSSRVHPLILYGTGAALLCGAGGGIARSVLLLIRLRPEFSGPALLWLSACVIFSVASFWLGAAIFFPWL